MKKTNYMQTDQDWHKKPSFGCLYVPKGSNIIHMSIYYFKRRVRFTTNKEDTKKNWDELCDFLDEVGKKIKQRTFKFAKSFYWLDDNLKKRFSQLEGNDYNPEPEHVRFGDIADTYVLEKIPEFVSVSKRSRYGSALKIHIIPYFKHFVFSKITPTAVEEFIDGLKRFNRSVTTTVQKREKSKPLPLKTIKDILTPLRKVWKFACKSYSWALPDPFSDLSEAYTKIADQALLERDRNASTGQGYQVGTRAVFLLQEWQLLLKYIDPHYYPVLDLLLMGMIGSELMALRKQDIEDEAIYVHSKVLRENKNKMYFSFTIKTKSRERKLPLTKRLRALIESAKASSNSTEEIVFENDIRIRADEFVLTMKDGSPFNYNSFVKRVWNKAIKKAGIPRRTPYACRHTTVQWSLLIGVTMTRLVEIMGHATKKMIYEVYGKYRDGLVEEREAILDYLGEDFLALEELKIAFPERYRRRVAVMDKAPEAATTGGLPTSFTQSKEVYPDNYEK